MRDGCGPLLQIIRYTAGGFALNEEFALTVDGVDGYALQGSRYRFAPQGSKRNQLNICHI
jgi:hypothetical protein